MGLSEYRRKRDFAKTPEPEKSGAARGRRVFVVQKHAARSTHYDLRLQVGDVLRSWAVPKGPSLDPHEKRLAVEVEDHPLEYATFEGVIPEGQYGAGAMMVWDRGFWAPEGDAARALADGEMKFRLEGERLKGRWMLVRTRSEEKQPAWLLIKERDRDAAAGVGAETFATSVLTGRTMDEIAAGAPARERSTPAPQVLAPSVLDGARAAPMPARVKPQLAQPSETVPDGVDWWHEVKFDGYRLLIHRRADTVRILSRNGLDWTAKLPALADTVRERLGVDAVLDGEAVILDTRGVSDFQALQNAIHHRRAKSVVYFAFDLPWCDGHDLARCTLADRKALLASLIGTRQEGRLRLSEHFEGDGALALERVCEHGLEGLISKRRTSPYASSRSADWVKVKCFNQQEFVVGGFTAPEGTREHLGALLIGHHDAQGRLIFCGKVGTGFSAETLRALERALRAHVRSKSPFFNPPTGAEARGVTWVQPELVAQVQFRDWSSEGMVRHTSFRGLRDDVDPAGVTREGPSLGVVGRSITQGPPPARTPTPGAIASPAASRLTNPERVVYPDRGAGFSVTKQQVAAYYQAVGGRMLEHLAGRPLAVLRCPDGEGAKSFFQKHPAKGMPSAVRGIDVPGDDGSGVRHLMIEDIEGLLGLVQMSVLEFHPWGCAPGHVDEPDRVVFDLDPGPDVTWRQVIDGGVLLRDALRQVGLTSFARTSGGKGLHVIVPLKRGQTWDTTTRFARAVAETMMRIAPKRFVATSIIEQRRGRIYVDYLRNVRGATAIAAYSTRARPGAPVATPVGWDELPGLDSPASFNIHSVARRVASGAPDPWAAFASSAASLPAFA